MFALVHAERFRRERDLELCDCSMPIFLYNYTSRKLHGIWKAASDGGWKINPEGKLFYFARRVFNLTSQVGLGSAA